MSKWLLPSSALAPSVLPSIVIAEENICIYSSDLINNSVYNKISKTINSVLYEFIKEIIDPAIILKLKKELKINLNKFLKQLIIFIKL